MSKKSEGHDVGADQDLTPNFTQFPNKLMDYIIPLLRESEEKVLIYVLRCTYGYRDKDGKEKEQDYISYSQFIGGRVSHDGKILNFGAGVGRAKLSEALAFHQSTGLIERIDPAAGKQHAGRGGTGLYRLNRDCEIVHFLNQYLQEPDTARERMVQYLNQKRLLVQKVNQTRRESKKHKAPEKNGSESEPIKNGSESEPEMVQKVNTQNKEKERNTKDTPPTPLPEVPKKKGRQKVDAHPMPEDYQPSEKNRQGIIARYPGANVDRLVDAMESWAHSGGVQKCDWEAELRTFARRDWVARGSPERLPSHKIAPDYQPGDIMPDGSMKGSI